MYSIRTHMFNSRNRFKRFTGLYKGKKYIMKFEEAIVDYFSKVVGTLVSIIYSNKILDEEQSEELINIITDGINGVSKMYFIEKSVVDTDVKV